ncbi:MAG TPA: YdcF family protein, partial [Terriglobia bacterium]|nr:YdcF family protein [Terriglobia bacterium]
SYSKTIITTGSYGPDPNYSEAHVATEYLAKHGVDEADIITEQASVTTHDSIRAASLLVKSKSWKTVLVVSDGFHLFRAKEMFEDEGIKAYTSPAPDSPIEASASQRLWYSLREVFLFSAYRLVDL